MPQIEELQTTAKAVAPGWSYVVDTGYDPSKAAINPTRRKRARTGGADAGDGQDLTLRQQTAINRHLAELDKDGHKGDAIPVPRVEGKKQTLNVRRILGSGKTFSHHVQDEEALLSQQGGPSAVVDTPSGAVRASKTPIARRKTILVPEQSSSDASPAPPAPMGPPRVPAATATAQIAKTDKVEPWNTSILTPTQPLTMTEEEIEALLAAPPLRHNAAKSAPPPASAPRQRVFCEICGYWGRVRCMKCGARVCGVECRTVHDESRCLKFYA